MPYLVVYWKKLIVEAEGFPSDRVEGIGTGTTHTTSERLLVDYLIKAEAGAKSCFFITFVPVKQLEDITEFRSSPELVEKLYTHGILKTYKAGSVILNENSHIRSIPIVIKGVMKVIRTEDDGREILLYYIKAGESCIMSFLGGLHNETSKVKVEIEDDAEILFLPISKVSLFM